MQEKDTKYVRKEETSLSDVKSIKENFLVGKIAANKKIMETTLYHSPDIVDRIIDCELPIT